MANKRKGDDWEGVTFTEVPGSKMRKVTCKFCDKAFSAASAEHLLAKIAALAAAPEKIPWW
ncbi:hypothetical protein DIPPA_07011 [Diplonema papillatum]|nr:hypothetical protein DIPPA_07011 [Diplonema papillatum]